MLRPLSAVLEGFRLEDAQETLRLEGEALRAVADRLDESFLIACSLLVDCEGAVIVTGVGKSGLVGQTIVATLASTGTPAHFLHPAEAMHGDLGRVTSADCVLALSHGGESAELVQLLPALKARGAPLVAVSSRAGSTLVRAAQAAVVYGPVDEACPLKLAPSTSCAVMLAIGHALAFALMRRRGYAVDDFQQVHPSGSLGRLSRPVAEVMRTGAEMRVAPADRSIREVWATTARRGRRTGAVILVNALGELAGLFTDSDLARLLEQNDAAILERPIAEFMTKRPLVLRAEQRVRDAVEVMRDRHVSEIPVLDGGGRPMGIVDITDLMDLMPARDAARGQDLAA
jgi:arabinose-5-phosphate isomerase